MAGAGYKLFNTGDVLTAAQVNTYLQEQAVMRFANSTARTTALSGVLAEGMVSYLDDTNAVEVYNGSAWVSIGSSGDITGVTAGTGISGGGTSGDVTITNSMATAIDAKGDLIVGTGADTFSRLAVGATNGHTLQVDSSTATGLKWAANSGASFVGASAFKNTSVASQSIANNTATAITFNDEDYDTDGFHSTSTNTSRFTVPAGKAGYYLLSATISYDVSNTGNRALYFYKNGSAYQYGEQSAGISTWATMMNAAIVINLAVSDYVELYAFQNTGGNLDVLRENTNTRMQITYLGA